MLLTIPATLALAVAAGPIIAALFQGGRYTAEDAAVTGNILAILVTGLPAYVLVKVLTPGFYARKNVKTPVKIAIGVLLASVAANFVLIPYARHLQPRRRLPSAAAWVNFALLFILLAARGHFRDSRLALEPDRAAVARGARHGRRALLPAQPVRRLFRGLGGAADRGGRRDGRRREASSISRWPG